MPRLRPFEPEGVPEAYHHPFTDEYRGGRRVFRAWTADERTVPELLDRT